MKKIITVLLLFFVVSSSDADDNVLMDYKYTYDNNGNVKSVDGAPIPSMSGRQLEYQYTETGNRIHKITDTRTGEVLATYSYDERGNTTSDGKYTYIYNQHNRLAMVKVGNVVIGEYSYNGFGRRIKKIADSAVTHYHYNSSTGELLAESKGDGTPQRDYIYLNGELLAMKVYGDLEGFYYFLNDHLGTPQKIVNADGAVVWAAAYMPFGEAQILVETLENNIRFKGQYYDKETGNHYNINRYYNPKTGRYLTPDPIGLAGGINLYPYVLNNPINMVDPEGLYPCDPAAYAECEKRCQAYGTSVQFCNKIIILGIVACKCKDTEEAPDPCEGDKPDPDKIYRDKKGNEWRFKPKKNWDGKPDRSGNFPSKDGTKWSKPTDHGGTHGKPHRDIQLPNGRHVTVQP